MRALTVEPGRNGSVRTTEVPEPDAETGDLLVEGLALGVCGADRDWLGRLVTRRVPLSRAAEAFTSDSGDVKVVVTLDDGNG